MRLPSGSFVLVIQRKRAIRLANTRKLARLVAAQPPNVPVHSLDITLTISTLSRISNPLPMPCTISRKSIPLRRLSTSKRKEGNSLILLRSREDHDLVDVSPRARRRKANAHLSLLLRAVRR